MAIPKSEKLSKEESQPAEMRAPSVLLEDTDTAVGPLQIREVQCLNDFVAILQAKNESSIAMPDAAKYRNEGVVVGVGPGVADGAGGRLKPCVEIGDMVVFGEKNVVMAMEPDAPPYAGNKVVIVSERNIICKLPSKVEWELYAEV